MEIVAEVSHSFCLDNGAFTIWNKGGKLDVDAYIKWVSIWHRHPGYDFAIIPDVIEGTQEENEYMLKQWPEYIYGAPVWHMHEDISWLQYLAKNYRIVCLGSSAQYKTPRTEAWWKRIKEAIGSICDEHKRPICKLHGLRMLDPRIFTKLPLSSADSTNCSMNSGAKDRFGIYVAPSRAIRAEVIASRIEIHNSYPIFEPDLEKQLKVQEDIDEYE